MKKIYIITGANGFLGNNIARKLEKYQDSEIRAFVLPNDKTKAHKRLELQNILWRCNQERNTK